MTEPTQPALRFVGERRMQCKDISDAVLIGAIRRTKPVTTGGWRMLGHVRDELEATIGWVPRNLLMAKLRKVCDTGQVGGCPCGCRGDFHLPEDCGDPGCCSQNSTGRQP
ncbi:hypothetical protein [Streptomyces sp. NPDC048200]|uniref:hypothetical protein n=1 Tax=Streptomyces sp. NPDC048200 TaxID=3365512 RepID=UPI00371F5413